MIIPILPSPLASPSPPLHLCLYTRTDSLGQTPRADDTLHSVSLSAYLCTLNDHHLPVVLIAVEQLSYLSSAALPVSLSEDRTLPTVEDTKKLLPNQTLDSAFPPL